MGIHMDTKAIDRHLAWCAAWNRAITQGKRPIEALALADQAARDVK
jgi:hypothetical protein